MSLYSHGPINYGYKHFKIKLNLCVYKALLEYYRITTKQKILSLIY